MFKTNTSIHLTLSMMRAMYLATRIYLGLAFHFGRIATVVSFLMTALTTSALPTTLIVLAVTVAHFIAIKLLDAGYRRAAAAIARPRPVAKPGRKTALKSTAPRAANMVQPRKAAPLQLATLSLSNFSHLHH